MESNVAVSSSDTECKSNQCDLPLSEMQCDESSLEQEKTCAHTDLISKTMLESSTSVSRNGTDSLTPCAGSISNSAKKLKLDAENSLAASVVTNTSANGTEEVFQTCDTTVEGFKIMNTPSMSEDNGFGNDSRKRLCPSVVDRYYTKRYEVNLPKGFKDFEETKCTNFNDVCILRHSNKLCIITLAQSHPIIKNRDSLSVTEVSYKVNKNLWYSA